MFEKEIEAGAAWLDEHRPGWENEIRLDLLNMRYGWRGDTESPGCVLCQLYGSYDLAAKVASSYVGRIYWGKLHGFWARNWDLEAEWEALDAEWTEFIEERRAEAGTLLDLS